MDKKIILEFLKENELSEVEELMHKEDVIAVRFFYDFDDDEIDGAKAYANDESEDEEEGETWYNEFFLPYLSDIAADNVGEIMEETMEKFSIDAQYVSYEIDEEDYDYNEFIAVFFPQGKDIEIEEILEELNL